MIFRIKRKVVDTKFSQSNYTKPGSGTLTFVLECGHIKFGKTGNGYRSFCFCTDCEEISDRKADEQFPFVGVNKPERN